MLVVTDDANGWGLHSRSVCFGCFEYTRKNEDGRPQAHAVVNNARPHGPSRCLPPPGHLYAETYRDTRAYVIMPSFARICPGNVGPT